MFECRTISREYGWVLSRIWLCAHCAAVVMRLENSWDIYGCPSCRMATKRPEKHFVRRGPDGDPEPEPAQLEVRPPKAPHGAATPDGPRFTFLVKLICIVPMLHQSYARNRGQR
jgi:hypothetical protein